MHVGCRYQWVGEKRGDGGVHIRFTAIPVYFECINEFEDVQQQVDCFGVLTGGEGYNTVLHMICSEILWVGRWGWGGVQEGVGWCEGACVCVHMCTRRNMCTSMYMCVHSYVHT